MAGFSSPKRLVICGSHAGVSIGEDGPSQMALEDLAMMRPIFHCSVLYPSDAVSSEKLVATAANTEGIVYIRTTRPKTPILYGNDEEFPLGGSKVLRSSAKDKATIVAAGITLHEALAAHDILAKEGIAVRVIDAYSIKPIDAATLRKAAEETGTVVTAEDHSVHGGLGDAVASALPGVSVRILGVQKAPRSGKSAELMAWAGIDAKSIAAAVRQAV
jgi:transketolase